MTLSMRAYAAHRKSKGLSGGSLMSVQKAIQSGRIEVEANGKIDPIRADRDWAGNTLYVPMETLAGVPASHRAAMPPDGMGNKHAMIRAARDATRLEIERIELAVMRETYIEVSKVKEEFEQIVMTLRTALESIPTRIKAHRPEMSNEDMLLIERMIRQAMNDVVRFNPAA